MLLYIVSGNIPLQMWDVSECNSAILICCDKLLQKESAQFRKWYRQKWQ